MENSVIDQVRDEIDDLAKKEIEYMNKLEDIEGEFLKLDEYEESLNEKINEIERARVITQKNREILVFKLDSLRITINQIFKEAVKDKEYKL